MLGPPPDIISAGVYSSIVLEASFATQMSPDESVAKVDGAPRVWDPLKGRFKPPT